MNRVKKDVIRARFNNSKQIVAFENINTIRVDKLEDRLALYYEYKPKLKIEEIRIQQDFRNEMELDKYFTPMNFIKLDNYLINYNNVAIVSEDFVKEENIYNVSFYFSNEVKTIKFKSEQWQLYKSHKLF